MAGGTIKTRLPLRAITGNRPAVTLRAGTPVAWSFCIHCNTGCQEGGTELTHPAQKPVKPAPTLFFDGA